MCACVFISEYFVLYLPKIKVDEFLDLTWMDLIFKSSTGGLVDHVILAQGCSYQERSCTRGALCWQNFLYPDLFLSWPPFHIGRVSVSDTLPVLHIRECLAISEKSREVPDQGETLLLWALCWVPQVSSGLPAQMILKYFSVFKWRDPCSLMAQSGH